MDTPCKFAKSTCFFSNVDGTNAYLTHHPIANEIRIQIMPSVDRPLVGTVKIVVCISHHNGSIS